MGRGYQAICARCDTTVEVHEGSGMYAMPFRCEECGREWWWEFGPGGPMEKGSESATVRMRGPVHVRRATSMPEVPLDRAKPRPERLRGHVRLIRSLTT